MDIIEHTPTGTVQRTLTLAEVRERAKNGDRQAIRELIDLKGGWAALTNAQKDKVMQHLVLLGNGEI